MQNYNSDKIMSLGECVCFPNFLLVCVFRLQALLISVFCLTVNA